MSSLHIYIDESGIFGSNKATSSSYVGAWITRCTAHQLAELLRPIAEGWANGLIEPERIAPLTDLQGEINLPRLLHWGELFKFYENKNEFPKLSDSESAKLVAPMIGLLKEHTVQFIIADGTKNYYTGSQDLYVWNLRKLLHGLLAKITELQLTDDDKSLNILIATRRLKYESEQGKASASQNSNEIHQTLKKDLEIEFKETLKIDHGLELNIEIDAAYKHIGLACTDLMMGASLWPHKLGELTSQVRHDCPLAVMVSQAPPDSPHGWWQRVRRALEGQGEQMDLWLMIELIMSGSFPEDLKLVIEGINNLLRLSELEFKMKNASRFL